jgi:hypothetical protein
LRLVFRIICCHVFSGPVVSFSDLFNFSFPFEIFIAHHISADSMHDSSHPVIASVSKQAALDWLRDHLQRFPNFSIRAKHSPMANHPFPLCLDRDDALQSTFLSCQHQLDVISIGIGNPRVPLSAVVAAPGAGKTFFLGAC